MKKRTTREKPDQEPRRDYLDENYCGEKRGVLREDGKLLVRLNHVMRRVGLPQLPPELAELFPEMRAIIRSRRHELLPEHKSQL